MTNTSFQVAFVALGLLYPDVAITPLFPLAQACQESGNFTSHVWEVDNNCFGMKAPAARETTCTNKGQAGAYAHFTNPLDCLRDYFLWCRAWNIKNDADLERFINTKYSETKTYGKAIATMVASLKKKGAYIEPAKILAGVLAVGVGTGVAVTAAAVAVVSEIVEEVG